MNSTTILSGSHDGTSGKDSKDQEALSETALPMPNTGDDRVVGVDQEKGDHIGDEVPQGQLRPSVRFTEAPPMTRMVAGGPDKETVGKSMSHTMRDSFVGNFVKMPTNMSTLSDATDESAMERALSEDIYSLFFTEAYFSRPFAFATAAFLVQFALTLMIFLDLMYFNGHDNVLQIPPGVPLTVNIAQALGCLIIISTTIATGDITAAIAKFVDGYDKISLTRSKHRTCVKWYLSGCLQFITGLLMVFVLFVLMMQSTTIVNMCLNFAALMFVSEIDDVTFVVAKRGFLSHELQVACLEVPDQMVPMVKRRRLMWMRRGYTVFLALVLYTSYVIIVYRQWSGVYVCNNLLVQFGDAYIPELAYFSGEYSRADPEWFENKRESRSVYFDATKNIRLSYCGQEEAWTFSLAENSDQCDYLFKSETTKTFNVADLQSSTWYTWNLQTMTLVEADRLYITCNDCGDGSPNCKAGHGVCDPVTNRCTCNEGFLGANCEYPEPTCNFIAIDRRAPPLPTEEGVFFPETYSLYRHHMNFTGKMGQLFVVQNRPVYAADKIIVDGAVVNSTQLLFFSGRRWMILSDSTPTDQATQVIDPSAAGSIEKKQPVIAHKESEAHIVLKELFESFNETDLNLRPFFFSSPVDFGTPTDTLEPTGLEWYRSRLHDVLDSWSPDESQTVGAKFLCGVCNETTNPCYNSRSCFESTGTCNCGEFFEGHLCENPVQCDAQNQCYNDGQCIDRYGFCECDDTRYYGSLCQYSYPLINATNQTLQFVRTEPPNVTYLPLNFTIYFNETMPPSSNEADDFIGP